MSDILNLTPEQRRQIYEEEKKIRDEVREKIRQEEEYRLKVREELAGQKPAPPLKNQKAEAAYICALLSLLIGPLASIPAIILGKIAQEECERDGDKEGKKKAKLPPDTIIYPKLKCPNCGGVKVLVTSSPLPIRHHKCEDCGYKFKSIDA